AAVRSANLDCSGAFVSDRRSSAVLLLCFGWRRGRSIRGWQAPLQDKIRILEAVDPHRVSRIHIRPPSPPDTATTLIFPMLDSDYVSSLQKAAHISQAGAVPADVHCLCVNVERLSSTADPPNSNRQADQMPVFISCHTLGPSPPSAPKRSQGMRLG